MKQELKRIDIHKDYTMFLLVDGLNTQITTITAYMQANTPYGNEYEEAYKEIKKLRKAVDKLVDRLQDTIECRPQSSD